MKYVARLDCQNERTDKYPQPNFWSRKTCCSFRLLAVISRCRSDLAEATNKVDEHGYYVLHHHVLVRLRFLNVVELQLNDFNHQNVLFDLRISDVRERQSENVFCEVWFDPSFGMGALFQCRAIEVVDVTPCNEGGVPIAT